MLEKSQFDPVEIFLSLVIESHELPSCPSYIPTPFLLNEQSASDVFFASAQETVPANLNSVETFFGVFLLLFHHHLLLLLCFFYFFHFNSVDLWILLYGVFIYASVLGFGLSTVGNAFYAKICGLMGYGLWLQIRMPRPLATLHIL